MSDINKTYLIGLSATLSEMYNNGEYVWLDDIIGRANSDLQHLHCLNTLIKEEMEIWMFLPSKMINGKWVILEEPDKRDYIYRSRENYEEDLCEYNEAKDKCLFCGFEVIPSRTKATITLRPESNESYNLIFLIVGGIPRLFGRNRVFYICDVGFELTKTGKDRLKLIDNQ